MTAKLAPVSRHLPRTPPPPDLRRVVRSPDCDNAAACVYAWLRRASTSLDPRGQAHRALLLKVSAGLTEGGHLGGMRHTIVRLDPLHDIRRTLPLLASTTQM